MLRGERLRERGMDEKLAAAGSECSSGCQSGWTTYLDDHSSYSYSYPCGTGTARFLHGNKPHPYRYHCDYSAEEDDLSMISDASSGPRHQSSSAGNDDAEGRVARREEPAASKRRNTKRAAAASLLEDTASSPAAFFGYSKAAAAVHGARAPNSQAVVGLGELVGNGYGGAGAEMMTEIGNAADFSSYAFSTTTGFKAPLSSGTAWGGGYMQMHYSPAPPVNTMPTRQARRDASEKKRW